TDPSSVDTAAGFKYAWTVTKDGNAFASGTSANLTFTPDDNGTYVVTLTATDKDGGVSAPASTTITADNVAPRRTINRAPAHSSPGVLVSMTSTVTDPTTVDTAAGFKDAWNVTKNGAAFGSGTSANFSFTPDTSATYVVTLTATDKDGGVGTTQQSILVDN